MHLMLGKPADCRQIDRDQAISITRLARLDIRGGSTDFRRSGNGLGDAIINGVMMATPGRVRLDLGNLGRIRYGVSRGSDGLSGRSSQRTCVGLYLLGW
jgi:hypothetical protein